MTGTILAMFLVVGCISPTPTQKTFHPNGEVRPQTAPQAKPAVEVATAVVADNEFARPASVPGECIIRYHNNYIVSYSEKNLIANWVAYQLTKEQTYGTGDRKKANMSFRQDPSISVRQADYTDYRGSGFVKGHMAPAADFKTDDEVMWETFYFPNCCPQPHDFNQGQWEELERRVRGWARNFGSIYLVTGTIIGEGKRGKIGANGVSVPDIVYKAVLASRKGQYQAIAFIMDNDDSCPTFSQCVYTINELEQVTGLDFFPALDDSVEESVESTYDLTFWQISR